MTRWLLLLSFGLCGCGGPGRNPAPAVESVHVKVATCGRNTVVRQVELPGDVKAYQEAQLFARVSGYLDSVLVDRGDRVVRGQLLARLRLPEAERELAQAQANQAKGQSELEASRGRVLRSQNDRATALADYRRSQAQKQQLQAELARTQAAEKLARAEKQLAEANRARLLNISKEDAGLVALQELDVSRTSLEVAEQKLLSAHSLVAAARQSLEAGDAAVDSARTRVDASSSQMRVVQSQLQSSSFQTEADFQAVEKSADLLSYTEIRAPFAGTITGRFLDPGALVQTSDRTAQQATRPVLSLADFDRVRVRAEPPQDVASLIDRGTPTEVRLETPQHVFKARVSRTSGSLDAAARTMVTEIDVANPKHLLRPGMYVKVVLDVDSRKNVLAVPSQAVVVERKLRSVVVTDGQKAHRVLVKTGLENARWVEIIDGLKEGQEVVVSSPAKLAEGTQLIIDR